MTDSGKPDDDWRLGHAKTFDGTTWHRRRYFIWKPNWDHDHCEFCFASFEVPGSKAAQDDDTQTEGWTSEDEYHWICDTCFADFRTRFQWQVRLPGSRDHADSQPEEADRLSEELRRKHERVVQKDPPS